MYANAYSGWAFFTTQLGATANYIPIILVVLMLASAIPIIKNSKNELKKRWLLAGIVCVVIALILPQSTAPAKRIHVAEYAFLSLIVFTLQRQKLAGLQLIGFSVTITLLYGAHDEMIQGLLPTRSFGFKDILVDGLSGLGGVCMAYAITNRSPQTSIIDKRSVALVSNKWLFIAATILTFQILGISLVQDKQTILWAIFYAISVLCVYGFSLYKVAWLWEVNRSGMIVISSLALSLLLYLSSTALFPSWVFK